VTKHIPTELRRIADAGWKKGSENWRLLHAAADRIEILADNVMLSEAWRTDEDRRRMESL
jgi:hypothetical protein